MEWNLLISKGNRVVDRAGGHGTTVALLMGDDWDYWQGGLK